jgi:hypothetical protein
MGYSQIQPTSARAVSHVASVAGILAKARRTRRYPQQQPVDPGRGGVHIV